MNYSREDDEYWQTWIEYRKHMSSKDSPPPEQPWTIDDPRMWKEQCRVGDVAFQHLFCTSHGKPVPDWVKEGLPRMYHLLESHSAMMDELALAIKQYNELLMAVARKFPGETRHETALRYIREAEANCHGGPCDVGSLP